ncbi:NUDIX domain-containing protein [Shewanella sp. cp20]|uniref:NUDIX domain-containing protein n=1 Tax=Shewanella sp. cp20 TaxID=1521167 RepID=UPI0005A044FF|nr:NUDIX hydrolase [Shewanella sp. cp20]KIO37178.1 DNA mismatch repair protein MutT [Shewanella sp. cp20]
MRLLKSTLHPDLNAATPEEITGQGFTRRAARAIVLRDSQILMLYTERYHDYSIPGGGVDEGEDIRQALLRELEEETGAHTIQILSEFGRYQEFRPWHKPGFDFVQMESYCFVCATGEELGDTRLEHHELQNGMRPVWIDIHEAIAHNEHTMAHSAKKGLSIERETYLLRRIVDELLTN